MQLRQSLFEKTAIRVILRFQPRNQKKADSQSELTVKDLITLDQADQ